MKESKFGLLTVKTVVLFSLKGGKTKTIEHKFKEIALLPVLDVVGICDSSDRELVLFAKNGDGVLVVNCPNEISPIHVSSFQRGGSAIFLASSTSMLYKMKVTLNASKDGRNSSAVLEEVASHRPHLGRRVLLLMVAGLVYTHQRKSFRIGWRSFATAAKLTV